VAIQVQSITKRFGRAVALDDVTLDVPSGSLTALLGPSGGGKSTLLRVIAGLEAPDSGTVMIDGVDLTGVPARQRDIGFCFQHYAPFRHLTVWKNVAFGLEVRRRPKPEIRARVGELLELVRISHLADRYPSQLSGGQRQRMALARALAIEPRVLLLDEPFGALDAKVRQQLRAWLRQMHEKIAVTTVLVTHDQEEAMEVASHLAIVNEGRIEQVGSPTELYDHPANAFVLRFLGPATELAGDSVRPHDLVIERRPVPGGYPAVVDRVIHLGFEVRVELTVVDQGPIWTQMSRVDANRVNFAPGEAVWVARANAGPATPGPGPPESSPELSGALLG
jgi:sulfate/thiosulfate transport system ATP-binding protein